MSLSTRAVETEQRVWSTVSKWLKGDYSLANIIKTAIKAFPALKDATIGKASRAWKKKLKAAYELANASALCYIVNDKGMRTGKAWARKYLKGWDVAACDKTGGFYMCLVHHEEKRCIFACRGTNPKDGLDLLADVAIVAMKLDEDPRFKLVRTACRKFAEQFPNYNLETTGHSLGGSLAIWAAMPLKRMAVAFNPGLIGDPLCSPHNLPVVYRVDGDVVSGGAKALSASGCIELVNCPYKGEKTNMVTIAADAHLLYWFMPARAKTAMAKLYSKQTR
jgi:hypothetical protein